MAFFKSFQQGLPSVTSLMDTVSSAMDDLTSTVSNVSYSVSDQLADQVTTLMSRVQDHEQEEQENAAGHEAMGQTGRRKSCKDRSPYLDAHDRGHGMTSTAYTVTSPPTDHDQSPGEGSQGQQSRAKNPQKAEETRAKSGPWSDTFEGMSRSSPDRTSVNHQDVSKTAASPVHSKASGKSRNLCSEITASASAGVITRKGDETSNGGAVSDDPLRDSCEESPVPYSKLRKEKNGRLQKTKAQERMEEKSSLAKMSFDAAQTLEETEASEKESRSPESWERRQDVEKAAQVRKSQRDSSGQNSGKCRDGTREGKSRPNMREDGDMWDSLLDSNSERWKKPAESLCHSELCGAESACHSELCGEESVCHSQPCGAESQRLHSQSWETHQKCSPKNTQYRSYSSEGSTEEANCIQRMNLEEQRPPPYQDEPPDDRRGNHELSCRKRRPHARHDSEDRGTPSQHKELDEDVPSDSTVVLGQEDMSAEGSALLLSKGYEPEPLAKYGTLDVAFDYDLGEQRLAVTVTAATDIPALRRTGNVAWQVHLVLLPTKQQRAKTGVQRGPCPVFTETFKFSSVESETIGSYAVRFRLYSVRRMRKERVMGEKVFYLTKLNLQGKMSVPVALDPGCTIKGCGSLRSVSGSDVASSYRSAGQVSRPEILLGLLYSSTTGRLSVEVIKGSHFRDASPGKPPTLSDGLFCCLKHLIGGQLYIIPDTFVKLTMMNSMGQEMSKCKTSTCRGRPDPMYKETFAFPVALFQLSEVTLLLSVFCRRGLRGRERLGWVSLGLNSSGEEETSLWAQVRAAEGQQVCRWLTLLDS